MIDKTRIDELVPRETLVPFLNLTKNHTQRGDGRFNMLMKHDPCRTKSHTRQALK